MEIIDYIKGKILLVQGAGRSNLGLVKTAKQLGVKTVITGMGGDYPCTPLADVNCYADISNPEAVLKVAKEQKIDGAIICCSDTGLRAVGRCNDVLHLTGITEEAAIVSSNKFLMKEKLQANGVRTAAFFKVTSEEDLQHAVQKIGFPVIIKATDLQGSRGIAIVRDEGALLSSFHEVMSLTRQSYCIVEEFLEGKEYGAQSFVYDGEVLFVLPHGDETIMCKTAVPVGHYMPYKMDSALYDDTCKQVRTAINALGLNNCAVNVDLIEKDGKAYIIELTGRVGANCLPELVGNYFGINYYEMILRTALGDSPLSVFEKRKTPSATLARMIQFPQSGRIKDLVIPSNIDAEIHMFVSIGDSINKFTNSNDAIGEIIVSGNTMDICENKMQNALEMIKISVDNHFVHDTATTDNVSWGDNSKVFKQVVVKNTELGDNSIIGDYGRVENCIFGKHVDIQRYSMIYHSQIGDYTYTGRNFICWHANIGKFCSISWNVSIGGANHDYNRIAQHAFLYARQFGLLDGEPLYDRFLSKCNIGNDVWIGCNAVICRNVTIGDGAVIAAGAIVTKDVEPYTIVAGVPAKVIKRRCSKSLADKLINLKWWNLPSKVIKDNLCLFGEIIDEESIDKIAELVKAQ